MFKSIPPTQKDPLILFILRFVEKQHSVPLRKCPIYTSESRLSAFIIIIYPLYTIPNYMYCPIR